MARADWFNRAPLPDDRVPEGELWVKAKEHLARSREVIERMSKLDI